MNRFLQSGFLSALAALLLHSAGKPVLAQKPAIPATSEGLRLEEQLDELSSKIDALRDQLRKSLDEMQQLRTQVRSLHEQLGEKPGEQVASHEAESLREGISQLQDTTEVLKAEVKVHDQTKVETASKFPLRITGTLLVTSLLNTGSTDDYNLPIIALPKQTHAPNGSLSATATQTILGLDARGPRLWGGQTMADLSVDFWGSGSSSAYYSTTAGLLRMRTAHARLEWPRQSIGIALDRPLMSPVRANSWLTIAEPAFAWSGNLWSWLPQLEYQRSFIHAHRLDVQLGMLDVAAPSIYNSNGQPVPNAAERSRQPGYEARVSTESSSNDLPFILGASGYYSRKAYSQTSHVDSWAVAADWEVPFSQALALSGQFYRGRALGGLGGGAFKDYVTSYGSPYGLNAAGGWTQLGWTATPTFQVNAGFGMDDAFAKDLNEGDSMSQQNAYAALARNQTALANVIYRPKTYLLLSAEFRQINSRSVGGEASRDNVFGLVTGYTF